MPVWLLRATTLASVLAIIRIALFLSLPYDKLVGLFDDDAFYYFGVAHHIAEGDGSTFNGIDPTNGYHPLWLAMLVPVFAVTSGRAALLAVTLLAALLFVMAGVLLDRLGQVVGRPVLVTIAAVPLLFLGVAGPTFWFRGMETAVLLVALLVVVLRFVTAELSGSELTTRSVLGLGVALAIAVLARLDAVFPCSLIGLTALVMWRRRGVDGRRLVLALAGPTAMSLAAYAALNAILFDTILPVSGQAKSLGSSPVNTSVIRQFAEAPLVFRHTWWLGAAAGILALLAAWLRGRAPGPAALARLGLIVYLGGALTVGYYATTSSWTLWPWYFYAAPMSLMLCLPSLLDRVGWPERTWRKVGAVVCASTVAVGLVNAARLARPGVPRTDFVETAVVVAAAIDALPVDGPIALGDRAGSLGYHVDRPTIHLEGLVNSVEYLDALRSGSVASFLSRRDVGLYARADGAQGDPAPGAGPGCRRFPEPQQGRGPKVDIVVCDADLLLDVPIGDGTSYRVWRYDLDLNDV